MKVIVLGAGVVGVTTAYFLARAGHEVTVVERQPGAAMETSFGNAGEISPGYSTPWPAPGIPVKAVRWMLMKHGPLSIMPQMDWRQWWWMLRMVGNCTAAAYNRNKSRMVPIAEYSRDVLKALREETGILYDARAQGTIELFRTQKQVDGIGKDLDVLRQFGVAFEVLDRAGCVAAEPGLKFSAAEIAGGLRLPNDETGDCHLFTTRLAAMAADLGVTFLYSTAVHSLVVDVARVTGVVTSAGVLSADAYVAAMGSFTPFLVRPLGVALPVYPVKGSSITVPITDESHAPVSTLLDETYKVAITRFDDRIRVGGMAEVSDYLLKLKEKNRDTLVHVLTDLFPGSGNTDAASFWTGLRPMTPDSPPVIGAAGRPNLYLNTGHGTLGWTMACGSARVLADVISGRTPEVNIDELSMSRYRF